MIIKFTSIKSSWRAQALGLKGEYTRVRCPALKSILSEIVPSFVIVQLTGKAGVVTGSWRGGWSASAARTLDRDDSLATGQLVVVELRRLDGQSSLNSNFQSFSDAPSMSTLASMLLWTAPMSTSLGSWYLRTKYIFVKFSLSFMSSWRPSIIRVSSMVFTWTFQISPVSVVFKHLDLLRLELIRINVDGEAVRVVPYVGLNVDALLEDGLSPFRVEVHPERVITPVAIQTIEMVRKLNYKLISMSPSIYRRHEYTPIHKSWQIDSRNSFVKTSIFFSKFVCDFIVVFAGRKNTSSPFLLSHFFSAYPHRWRELFSRK